LDAATVPLSQFEIKRCERLVAEFIERRRPPARLRKDVDLAFRMRGPSVEIFEIRANWRGKGKPIEHRIAKATYDKRNHGWKIFWQRADLKWHRYEPLPEVDAIEDFLLIVEEDDHACFFG
jgi:Protein of unknown function (DUF3024)